MSQTRDLLCSCGLQAPSQVVEGPPPWALSQVGLRGPGKCECREPLDPRDQPEKEREGEGERERKLTRGMPSLGKNPLTLFSKGAYIP